MDTPTLLRGARLDCTLSRETELALWTRARQGDPVARQRLIESQLPWCWRIAARFARGRMIDDLFQEAVIELMRIVDGTHYDPAQSRLGTACTRLIRWRLRDFITSPAVRAAEPLPPEWIEPADGAIVRVDWSDAFQRMPAPLRHVAFGLATGYSLTELAKQADVTPECMRQRKLAARTWLLAHGCFTESSPSAPRPKSIRPPKPRQAA